MEHLFRTFDFNNDGETRDVWFQFQTDTGSTGSSCLIWVAVRQKTGSNLVAFFILFSWSQALWHPPLLHVNLYLCLHVF